MSKQIRKCAGKDSFQRMNYLYQVSNFLAAANGANKKASDAYSNLLVNISKKAVQRIDIDIKRTICKGCLCLLLAGISCKVRVKKKQLRWTCINCGTMKRYNCADRSYLPWPQREESIVEVLDFKPESEKYQGNKS